MVAQAKTHPLDKVVISGIIKDDSGNPIENVKVMFDTTAVALTDKAGNYSFELSSITPASHNIYFSCDGFSSAVRTYYPVMQSTNFNIMLRRLFDKPAEPAVVKQSVPVVVKDTARIINTAVPKKANEVAAKAKPITNTAIVKQTPKKSFPVVVKDTVAKQIEAPPADNAAIVLDFPSILFKPNETDLSNMNRAFLDIIARKLKTNPSVKIDIRSYVTTNNSTSIVAQTRLANIVKYMAEKKGIAIDRLNKRIIPGGGDVDIIDIEMTKPE